MAHALSPHTYVPWKDPFTKRTANGLFAAPWTERLSDEGIAAVQQLSELLMQSESSPDDLSLILGHLLAVHGHCQQAAHAREPRLCRQHYTEALHACEGALARLQQSKQGSRAALAAWALGVHTLIRAQLAMASDPPTGRLLAYDALTQLSGAKEPLCTGAEADSLSAMLLIRESIELESRLAQLPEQMRNLVDRAEGAIEQQETQLAGALVRLQETHRRTFAWSLGWVGLNLGLAATGPINSFYAPQIPWSLPFLVALVWLWYATWAKPIRDGAPFFTYLQSLRWQSLLAVRQLAWERPEPRDTFIQESSALLDSAHRDQERLVRFHLYQIPLAADTCWKARAIAAGAAERLQGEWQAARIDGPPWLLRQLLQEEASLLAKVTKIWFGPVT